MICAVSRAQSVEIAVEEVIVAVEQQDDVCLGGGDTLPNRFYLSLILLGDEPDPMLLFILFQNRLRIVRGAVVYDHQLVSLLHLRQGAVQRLGKELVIVIIVYDYGETGVDRFRIHGFRRANPSLLQESRTGVGCRVGIVQ